MIDLTKDIHSMTTFKRNSWKAEAVVLDAAAYQEVAEHLEAVAGIRRGLAQAKKGQGRPVDEVFDDLEQEPIFLE